MIDNSDELISTAHPQPCPAHGRAACGKRSFSPEIFQEAVDKGVETFVLLPERLHFLDRVDHGRMMFAAKASSDLGKRGVCERFAQIHGDLPRIGDLARIAFYLELRRLHGEALGHGPHNGFD